MCLMTFPERGSERSCPGGGNQNLVGGDSGMRPAWPPVSQGQSQALRSLEIGFL